jgi:hypothetical protein
MHGACPFSPFVKLGCGLVSFDDWIHLLAGKPSDIMWTMNY